MRFHTGTILLSAAFLTIAGEFRLSGKVTDKNSNSIESALVKLYSRDSIATRTDSEGYFELTEQSVSAVFRGTISGTGFTGESWSHISVYDFKGRLLLQQTAGEDRPGAGHVFAIKNTFSPGVYLINVRTTGGTVIRFRYINRGDGSHPDNVIRIQSIERKQCDRSRRARTADFNDVLVVSAEGMQTVRRAVVDAQEDDILIRLMPQGVNYITPGIPVFSDSGGHGDVTTYGSVSDPEFSQGGACNYGSTGIKYYAAINVNRFPGDARGQWNDGRCCGRCAKVRVRTSDGEVHTTVVRIVDKCPDDNCGIDLGGAPAGEIMSDQPGRYSGAWEWVNCDEYEGVSDGSASICTKEGTNEWWSLVQVRNGSGGVTDIRIRKIDGGSWMSLEWATEAENFYTVPEQMLQDAEQWEIEVLWDTGSRGSLLLPGNRLAVEDTSYRLTVSR